ncbi:hypothetical protein WJX82_011182 [Trebouxia sp. C0006]
MLSSLLGQSCLRGFNAAAAASHSSESETALRQASKAGHNSSQPGSGGKDCAGQRFTMIPERRLGKTHNSDCAFAMQELVDEVKQSCTAFCPGSAMVKDLPIDMMRALPF